MFRKTYIIDDDSMALLAAEHILSKFSDTLKCYSSAQTALDAILGFEQEGTASFVVFLDIHMPLMDGFEFLGAISQQDAAFKSRCRIVVMSSSIQNEEIKALSAHPLVECFAPKPLDHDTIKMLAEQFALRTAINY